MDIYLITERTKFSCFIYLFLFFWPQTNQKNAMNVPEARGFSHRTMS